MLTYVVYYLVLVFNANSFVIVLLQLHLINNFEYKNMN